MACLGALLAPLLPASLALSQVNDPSCARTFYVATNGSDTNPGTWTQPFATAWKVTSSTGIGRAGDCVFVRGGVYNVPGSFSYGKNLNGTAGERIKVAAYPGEQAVLEGININTGGQGLVLEGFEIRNHHGIAIGNSTGSGGWHTIRNNHIHHITGDACCNNGGIRIQHGRYWDIEGNVFHDIYNVSGSGPPLGGVGHNVFAIGWVDGGDHRIHGNRFWRGSVNAGQSCLLSKHGNKYPIEVYDNVFEDCPAWASNAGGVHTYFHHNLLINSNIAIEGQGSDPPNIAPFNTRIEYNTFVNAGVSGQSIHSQTIVRLNVIRRDVSSSLMIGLGPYISDAGYLGGRKELVSELNCFHNSAGSARFALAWYDSGGSAGPLGTTYASLAAWRSGEGKDLASLEADPLFADPAAGDYNLQPGSPCSGYGRTAGPSGSMGLVFDATPPVLSGLQPSGSLPSGATQTLLRVTTSEPASCRWRDALPVFDDPYGYGAPAVNTPPSSPLFTSTVDVAHEQLLDGLQDGRSYTFYVQCQDRAGLLSAVAAVSFDVGGVLPSDTAPPAPPRGLVLQ